MTREHVGLLKRVSSLMRPIVSPRSDEPPPEPSAPEREAADPRRPAVPEDIERRLAHLEALVEGLQDAVHRQARRHEEELDRIRRSVQPEQLARALSDDARRRGL